VNYKVVYDIISSFRQGVSLKYVTIYLIKYINHFQTVFQTINEILSILATISFPERFIEMIITHQNKDVDLLPYKYEVYLKLGL